MQMQHSEREQERTRLLEASQEEWTVKYAELQSTAYAASQRMQSQHQLVESQSTRLYMTEQRADEELGKLRRDASEMQQECLTIRDQLVKAETAEMMCKQNAEDAITEAEAAKKQNFVLWSEVSELQRRERAPIVVAESVN